MANVPSSSDRVSYRVLERIEPNGCHSVSQDGGLTWVSLGPPITNSSQRPYVGPSATYGSIYEHQQRLIYEQAKVQEQARIRQLEAEALFAKLLAEQGRFQQPTFKPQREDLNPNEDKTYVAQTDVLEFGKYKGSKLGDVPKDYILWLIGTREKDIKQYQSELDRRELLETQAQTTLDQIIQEGFKALAKKAHPDMGGSDKQFRELQAAKEQLKLAAEEVKRVQGSNSNQTGI